MGLRPKPPQAFRGDPFAPRHACAARWARRCLTDYFGVAAGGDVGLRKPPLVLRQTGLLGVEAFNHVAPYLGDDFPSHLECRGQLSGRNGELPR